MPIYEYRCEECGHVTSFLENLSSGKEHKCGKCGSVQTRKIFSTFAPKMGSGAAGAACADGSCATGACPTGTCPFA